MRFHLAQLNVAKAKFPLTDPRMGEFISLLAEVNSAGERSEGFVWILKDETGTAVNFNLFDDPLLLVNMTVWESLDDLRKFAYHGVHGQVFRRRKEWFIPTGRESTVLWWIREGHIPTVEEGKEKMLELWRSGPTPVAFSLVRIFEPTNQ